MMGVKRRDFLKILGVGAAGIGLKPAADMISGSQKALAAEEAGSATLQPGQHWAMVIDLNKLTEEDCERAAEACHRVHNVPDIRTKDGQVDKMHEIKWIWKVEYENAFPDQASEYLEESIKDREVLVLCNHCTSPPCVRVCPTQATFKAKSGIVVMDMHRCIGCRFCMAGCPYGSRSFNFMDPRPFIKETNMEYPTRTKGVVEKCNFCAERLFKGLQPACVEACESGAMTFGDLSNPGSEVSRLLREQHNIRRKPSLGTGPNIYYLV